MKPFTTLSAIAALLVLTDCQSGMLTTDAIIKTLYPEN